LYEEFIFAGGCMKRFPLVLLLGLMTAISLSAVQKSQPQKTQPQQSQPRIDEIVLAAVQGERDSGSFGRGFKITLRRDGTALFTGTANVKLLGDFQGTISTAEFEQLESFLLARKYDRIPDDPINIQRIKPTAGTAGITAYEAGSPYMLTVIGFEGGQAKTIFRPTNANGIDQSRVPKALLEIEQAVFDAATRIHWAKK
jgi:hypothetical protein